LTPSALAPILAAAIRLWQSTGLTADQDAALRGVTVQIADLRGGYLALTPLASTVVTLDDNAAGYGWYVDPTPADSAEFPVPHGTRLTTTPDRVPAGRMDLLTTVVHELGHVLGKDSDFNVRDRNDVMYAYLQTGERRLPAPVVPPASAARGTRQRF
jgi:hypothetical protein